MGVPAHDQRDFDFAKTMNLETIQVVQPSEGFNAVKAYTGSGKLINSEEFTGDSIVSLTDWIRVGSTNCH